MLINVIEVAKVLFSIVVVLSLFQIILLIFLIVNNCDVVEVVRCSKCKQWIKNSNLPTDTSGLCFYHYIDTNENDFCNYGERKDGKDINVPTK